MDLNTDQKFLLQLLHLAQNSGNLWTHPAERYQQMAHGLAMSTGYCAREIGNYKPISSFRISVLGILKLAEDGLSIDVGNSIFFGESD